MAAAQGWVSHLLSGRDEATKSLKTVSPDSQRKGRFPYGEKSKPQVPMAGEGAQIREACGVLTEHTPAAERPPWPVRGPCESRANPVRGAPLISRVVSAATGWGKGQRRVWPSWNDPARKCGRNTKMFAN